MSPNFSNSDHQIIKRTCAKKKKINKKIKKSLLFVNFSWTFDSIYKRKNRTLQTHGLLKETVTTRNNALRKHESNGLLIQW